MKTLTALCLLLAMNAHAQDVWMDYGGGDRINTNDGSMQMDLGGGLIYETAPTYQQYQPPTYQTPTPSYTQPYQYTPSSPTIKQYGTLPGVQ